jgi:hypothetical protein
MADQRRNAYHGWRDITYNLIGIGSRDTEDRRGNHRNTAGQRFGQN